MRYIVDTRVVNCMTKVIVMPEHMYSGSRCSFEQSVDYFDDHETASAFAEAMTDGSIWRIDIGDDEEVG